MSTLTMNYYPISSSSQQVSGGGDSAEAKSLFSSLNSILRALKSSDQDWVFNELEELSMEASHQNWDNLGSAPLDSDTYQMAKRFLLALPASLPAPELTADRDGEVNFDWFGPNGQIFSTSLRKDGRIAYAGQFSPRIRSSGVEEFNDAVPKKIVECIKIIHPR